MFSTRNMSIHEFLLAKMRKESLYTEVRYEKKKWEEIYLYSRVVVPLWEGHAYLIYAVYSPIDPSQCG